jgi:hypothetical protein
MEVTPEEIAIYRCKVESVIAKERARVELFGNLMEIKVLKLRGEIAKWELENRVRNDQPHE